MTGSGSSTGMLGCRDGGDHVDLSGEQRGDLRRPLGDDLIDHAADLVLKQAELIAADWVASAAQAA